MLRWLEHMVNLATGYTNRMYYFLLPQRTAPPEAVAGHGIRRGVPAVGSLYRRRWRAGMEHSADWKGAEASSVYSKLNLSKHTSPGFELQTGVLIFCRALGVRRVRLKAPAINLLPLPRLIRTSPFLDSGPVCDGGLHGRAGDFHHSDRR